MLIRFLIALEAWNVQLTTENNRVCFDYSLGNLNYLLFYKKVLKIIISVFLFVNNVKKISWFLPFFYNNFLFVYLSIFLTVVCLWQQTKCNSLRPFVSLWFLVRCNLWMMSSLFTTLVIFLYPRINI